MFFRYFVNNFNKLNIKELICTYYRPFGFQEDGWLIPPPVVTRIKKVCGKIDNLTDLFNEENNNPKPKPLQEDGDFRSSECIELLKESDVIVTNPPFSLFREYFAQLVENNKKFLILGSHTAVGYKEIFPYFQSNKVWLGINSGGCKWFQVSDDYEITTNARKKVVEGKKFFSMGNVVWFTNLDHSKRYEEIKLLNDYSIEDYPNYDNYDAIEVSRIDKIPASCYGVMGVPLTFMYHYNPSQFKIVGFRKGYDGKDLSIRGKSLYSRVLVKRVN